MSIPEDLARAQALIDLESYEGAYRVLDRCIPQARALIAELDRVNKLNDNLMQLMAELSVG